MKIKNINTESKKSIEFEISKRNLIIMVIYLNVKNLTPEQIEQHNAKVLERMQTQAGILEKWFLIPIENGESRIECLNPAIIEKGSKPDLEKQIEDNLKLFENL